MIPSSQESPDDLPVVYLHHGPSGDMLYADRPLLIVHVDDGQPQDRVVVRVADAPPADLIHGPVSCTHRGPPDALARKQALVEWLRAVAQGVAPLLGRGNRH